MLAKVKNLTRYKVRVLTLKPKKIHPMPAPDEVFICDGDTFLGYSYRKHRTGKFFDLWFANPKEDDTDNFITFGRITNIIPMADGTLYQTKIGRFFVEYA